MWFCIALLKLEDCIAAPGLEKLAGFFAAESLAPLAERFGYKFPGIGFYIILLWIGLD